MNYIVLLKMEKKMKKLIIFIMLLTSSYGYSMENSYYLSMFQASPRPSHHDILATRSDASRFKRQDAYSTAFKKDPTNTVLWRNYLRFQCNVGGQSILPPDCMHQHQMFSFIDLSFNSVCSQEDIENRMVYLRETAKLFKKADPMYQQYWQALLTTLSGKATKSLPETKNLDDVFAGILQTPLGTDEHRQFTQTANTILTQADPVCTQYWNLLISQFNPKNV